MKKKIFITGAAGLVGTEILQKIANYKYEISALYRKTKSIEKDNIKWIQGDIGDKNIDLRKALSSTSVLIHNAAEINAGISDSEKNRIQISNINFTQRLFDWAIEAGVQKIIFTSGLNLIETPLPSVILEDATTNPKDSYALSKLMSEEYLKKNALKSNIEYNIFRLSSPVSFSLSRMPNTVVKLWIEKSQRKEIIEVYGRGSRTQDFVSTHDIANVFNYCISESVISGIFNIASGTTLSMRELAELITSKFKNGFIHMGDDPKEEERWNISIDKAKRELNYSPLYSANNCITSLLNTIV